MAKKQQQQQQQPMEGFEIGHPCVDDKSTTGIGDNQNDINNQKVELNFEVEEQHHDNNPDRDSISITTDSEQTSKELSTASGGGEQLPNYNHQCYICDKIFSANSNLNRHLRKIHKENVQSPYNNVKCALCDSVFSSSHIYNQHLENDHQVKIDVENLTFTSKETFEDWKHSVENETTSQFIKSRGEKKTKNVNKTYYSCNRSGYYVSKARTRKALKKQGSRKINGRCPASMNVTINSDSTYDVRFVKTHVGHNFELKHLDLSDKDRDLIVQKLVSGLTKRDIIKQLRSNIDTLPQQTATNPTTAITATSTSTITPISFDASPSQQNLPMQLVSTSATNVEPTASDVSVTIGATIAASVFPAVSSIADSINQTGICTFLTNNNNPTARLHLATTKDIHNIINSKHLDSKLIRHNYDINNVEAWINEMKELDGVSSVLFYKSQNESINRFPQLREDDFMLIIMKDGQLEVLKEHGNKCIVIDSTHNMHCEYLHVTTVSTIDTDERSFPVAFLFSNRTDVDILEVLFTILQEKVGILAPKILIADELEDFYIAWSKVMTRPTHNLLTPWSVFENWSKKFDSITNKEKLRKLKKNLRSLLNETDSERFIGSIAQFFNEYSDDLEMNHFINYFETKYAKNPDLWSSCFRKVHGVSNQQLSKLHERFKAVYKEGKTSKKLCKYITSLMTLFDENQLKKLSLLEDKNPAKQKALQNRHRKSIETGSCVYELALEPVMWLCPSESSSESYYEVKPDNQVAQKSDSDTELKQKCCCDFICSDCNSCRHAYRCTCLDYVVNLNMCKHIHRICTMCK